MTIADLRCRLPHAHFPKIAGQTQGSMRTSSTSCQSVFFSLYLSREDHALLIFHSTFGMQPLVRSRYGFPTCFTQTHRWSNNAKRPWLSIPAQNKREELGRLPTWSWEFKQPPKAPKLPPLNQRWFGSPLCVWNASCWWSTNPSNQPLLEGSPSSG